MIFWSWLKHPGRYADDWHQRCHAKKTKQIGVLLPRRHQWFLPAICCTAGDCKYWSVRAHGPLRAHDADRCLYANEMSSKELASVGMSTLSRTREEMLMFGCEGALIREHGVRFGAECGEAVLSALLQIK